MDQPDTADAAPSPSRCYVAAPWHVGDRGCDSVFDFDGRRICVVMGNRDEPDRGYETEFATADVIAGSPDVLEAAEIVLEWYDRDGSVGGAVDPMEALREAVALSTTDREINPVRMRQRRAKLREEIDEMRSS